MAEEKTTFLSLSAELRNNIYEVALITEEDITVHREMKEPAILRCHPQIRREAIKLYYRNNTFVAHLRNCDATLLVKFCKFIAKFNDPNGNDLHGHVKIYLKITGRKNWANVLKWCEEIHRHRLYTWYWVGCRKSPVETVIQAAHQITKNSLYNLTWSQCLAILEPLGDVIGRYDSPWMRDL